MPYPKHIDAALLLLRLVFGLSMIYGHGWDKLVMLFSGDPIRFADPFGFGPGTSLAFVVFAETLCAALVALGLFTRPAALFLIGTSLVAIFYRQFQDPFTQMEKAILYLAVFTVLLLAGPGWYALDRRWSRRV